MNAIADLFIRGGSATAPVHVLKCDPQSFQAKWDGAKPMEVRKNDRGFRVDDLLIECEWDAKQEKYTGRIIVERVTYMVEGVKYGMPADLCAMATRIIYMDGDSNG